MRSNGASCLLVAFLLLATLLPISEVHASSESIPINGRQSAYVIGLRIPDTPKWAHDIVLNASIAWDQAQVWYRTSASSGNVYTLVASNDGMASISFSMPTAYAEFAVGWTDYQFAPSSKTTIISTQTYLDPSVFGISQANNLTARKYALRLALHELGRVLGLGSVLDNRDIMDPMATPDRAEDSPLLSTLDLYALKVLASGYTPSFVTLPGNVQNQFVPATTFISGPTAQPIPTPEFNGYYGLIAAICALGASLSLRRRRDS